MSDAQQQQEIENPFFDSVQSESTVIDPVQTTKSRAVVKIACSIAEYDEDAAALYALQLRHQNVVYDVTTKKGLAEAKVNRRELVSLRTRLEEKRKALKAPALERSRLIDAEATRIKDAVRELEEPIDKQIEIEEERQAEEKKRKEEAETTRIAALKARVDQIRNVPVRAVNSTSDEIEDKIKLVVAIEVGEDFAELQSDAVIAKAETLARLREMSSAAIVRETEEQRIKNERAELERLRQENAEREARDKSEREAREKQELEKREADEREAKARRATEEADLQRRRDEMAKREADEKAARDLHEREEEEKRHAITMAMNEIQGIQQQVFIARMGLSLGRKGGTIQCILDTLAETEAWPILDRFGALKTLAQNTKDQAVESIKLMLADAEKQEAIERAEKQRRDAENAERIALDSIQSIVSDCINASPSESAGRIAKMLTHVSTQWGNPSHSDRVRLAAIEAGKTLQSLHNTAVERGLIEAAKQAEQEEKQRIELAEEAERLSLRTAEETRIQLINNAAQALYLAGKSVLTALNALSDPDGELSCIEAGPQRDALTKAWLVLSDAIFYADTGTPPAI